MSSNQNDFTEKIQRKQRIVKIDRITKGNTVAHRQVDFSAQQFVIPGRVEHDEIVSSVSELIQMKNVELPSFPKILKKKSSLKSLVEVVQSSTTTTSTTTNVLSPIIEETAEEIDPPIVDRIESKLSISVRSSTPVVSSAKSPKTKKVTTQTPEENEENRIEIVETKVDEIPVVETFDLHDDQIETNFVQPISEIAMESDGKVIFHRFGLEKKKKSKKKKRKKVETNVDLPRKAVPFVSALENEQIEVEDETRRSSKKKRKKSSIRKKKKKNLSKEISFSNEKENSTSNREAIARHLLTVRRFTGPPISPIEFDRSRSKYDEVIEIPLDQLEHRRIQLIKPMLKNFDENFQNDEWKKTLQYSFSNDFSKEIFDFHLDTKRIDQPAIFNEFIRKITCRRKLKFIPIDFFRNL